MPVSDQLRELIGRSGLSEYELAKRAGVSRSNLSRFRSGTTHLSLPSLDRVAEVLGLKLIGTGRRPPRAAGEN